VAPDRALRVSRGGRDPRSARGARGRSDARLDARSADAVHLRLLRSLPAGVSRRARRRTRSARHRRRPGARADSRERASPPRGVWALRVVAGRRPGVHAALAVWGCVTLFLAVSQRLNVYYAVPLCALASIEAARLASACIRRRSRRPARPPRRRVAVLVVVAL